MRPFLLALALASTAAAALADDATLTLQARWRRPSATDPSGFAVVESTVTRDPWKTALIICDVWDDIYCKGAAGRINELAPFINRIAAAAREKGALVIHAPSGCMAAYEGHPARLRAQSAPRAADLPADISQWCDRIPAEERGVYPVDQADGGCDDVPRCKVVVAYSRENPAIEIKDEDAISDSGVEIWSLLAARGIEHVMLAGVHLNMCVLGRPFGLRNLVKNGKDAVLIRDLTDTMYNSRSWPHVPHAEGTERVVEHVEKYVCPTILSTSITGLPPFAFKPDDRPSAVFLIGEDEYQTAETLPRFAVEELEPNGVRCTFAMADPKTPNDFPAAEAIDHADLLFVSVRRRAPTIEQMRHIRKYVEAGKPVVGIRTACHAFDTRGHVPEGHADWPTFDPDVLGGHYTNHHGNGLEPTIELAPEARGHPILDGVKLGFKSKGSLYKVAPLGPTTLPLLTGAIDGKPAEPVAWVNLKGNSRVFFTSLGHPDDFQNPSFKRLLRNGVFWALDRPAPGAPGAPATSFKTPDDLAVDLVLSDPLIRQPVNINFDERDRMWLTEYAEYPHPSGLKILSRDGAWRVTYDKTPQPPPNQVRGLDRISIHEDVDGDGVYDRHKTFVQGLNIATSALPGRGGAFVLNPPYLLFHPDRDGDDVPDGDPEILLQGFGLEDTHSAANSLTWGPDGWIYAAQGSTVTGKVARPGDPDDRAVHSMGQLIWRYHPEKRIYEVFAEGGGNAFGVEIDARGRLFSGHNGGDTRGFHYVQGAYLQKTFDKHGALSNPYAFGFFPAMAHDRAPRFTHDFAIYEGGRFPDKYNGMLFGVAPLLNHVVISEMTRTGSTFRTRDVDQAMATDDQRFRPVDVTLGPDGFLYVADWHDEYAAHLRHNEGLIEADTGRVYRIRPRDAKPSGPLPNLGRLSSDELVKRLDDPNRWVRRTAARLLGERSDASLAPELRKLMTSRTGQTALEALWALNLTGGLDDEATLAALKHADAPVREWAARLACDDRDVSDAVAKALAEIAPTEPDVEVRAQLAASARRLPAGQALAVVRGLMTRDEDAGDPRMPLLIWWAIESQATADPDAVTATFREAGAWSGAVSKSTLQERLMRRFAAAGGPADLERCVKLLEAAPGPEDVKRLMTGLEAAYAGRSTASLPAALADALEKNGGASVVLGLRRGRPEAVAEANRVLADPDGDREKQMQYLRVLGEVRVDACRPAVEALALKSPINPLRSAALSALAVYDDPALADAVLATYAALSDDVRASVLDLLATRRPWATSLLEAAAAGRIDPRSIPLDVAARLRLLKDAKVDALVDRLFGPAVAASTAERRERVERLKALADDGGGTPKAGRALFQERCGRCHMLFDKGGNVGPDLTPYRRDDLDAMLLAVVDPSAEIREGYAAYAVATSDGRVLSGVRVDSDPRVVVLRTADGEERAVDRDDVEAMEPAKTSLMPDGLLDDLTDDQVRDLLAYLRAGQPVIN